MTNPPDSTEPGAHAPVGDEQPGVSWQPANDSERAMVAALTADDRAEFFRIIAAADLFLPQVIPTGTTSGETAAEAGPAGPASSGPEPAVVSNPPVRPGTSASDTEPGPGEQEFITITLFDQTFLPVFTSLEGLLQAARGVANGYLQTSYPELREKWPAPQWQLAINPGLPIDAYLPVGAVAEAAQGALVVPTAAEVVVDGIAEDPQRSAALDPHELLSEAAKRADVDGYLDALLDASVLVPTTHEVDDPVQALEQGAPWFRGGPSEQPVIEVFTSEEVFQRAHPERPSMVLPFLMLLLAWPKGHGLSINPGDPSSLEVPAAQVHELLLWADASVPTPRPEPET